MENLQRELHEVFAQSLRMIIEKLYNNTHRLLRADGRDTRPFQWIRQAIAYTCERINYAVAITCDGSCLWIEFFVLRSRLAALKQGVGAIFETHLLGGCRAPR